jgi:DNA repair photolyase
MGTPNEMLKGRGAQFNPANRWHKHHHDAQDTAYMDEEALASGPQTQFLTDFPKKIVNKVDSPDLPMLYSMNPYQGCEHGCVYCYARNAHEYWGFSAGLDFEQKIIVKPQAAQLLEATLRHPRWEAQPIMLSGNTDCYQPAERQYRLTRQLLEVLLKFRHPVGLITKNSLILRDRDLLQELARHGLVHVYVSITTLKEDLRLALEPRTATAARRLRVVRALSAAGIPTGVMVAPIIPGLNNEEIPAIVQAAADQGALAAGYSIVRLNGAIGAIFTDWVRKAYPDRADKVLHQIAECHGGQLHDSQYGRRMAGAGKVAEAIGQLFRLARRQYLAGRQMPPYNLAAFAERRGVQLGLF